MFGISMQRVVHLEVSPTFYNLDIVYKIKHFSILCIHPPYDLEIVTAAFSRAAVSLLIETSAAGSLTSFVISSQTNQHVLAFVVKNIPLYLQLQKF